MRTLKDLANQVLRIQDACNLSGVAHTFSNACTELWVYVNAHNEALAKTNSTNSEFLGTDWVNKHPIVTLYLDKLASLNGNYLHRDIITAYEEVRKLAESPDVI